MRFSFFDIFLFFFSDSKRTKGMKSNLNGKWLYPYSCGNHLKNNSNAESRITTVNTVKSGQSANDFNKNEIIYFHFEKIMNVKEFYFDWSSHSHSFRFQCF